MKGLIMEMASTIGKISFVIPVFDEEENISPLAGEILTEAIKLGLPFEILFINDGSRDKTLSVIKELAQTVPEVRYVSFTENCGQTAALSAGFQAASGDTIITLDGDMQNNPADIPFMLTHYGEHDMVTGWRHCRKDTFFRRIGSLVGNTFRNYMTGETIQDTGCSLKVMRASMAKRIKMFRGMHRFLPTLMRLEGARVIEVKVRHRPRIHGKSKYTNLKRGIEGFHDVLAVRWMIRRNLTPLVREKRV